MLFQLAFFKFASELSTFSDYGFGRIRGCYGVDPVKYVACRTIR